MRWSLPFVATVLLGCLLVGSLTAVGGVAQDTLFVKRNAGLKINVLGAKSFFVLGDFILLKDGVRFVVTDPAALKQKRNGKLYPYNDLVQNIDISYNRVVNVRRGCYALVVASKFTIYLDNGEKFMFDLVAGKKEAMDIIREKIKH